MFKIMYITDVRERGAEFIAILSSGSPFSSSIFYKGVYEEGVILDFGRRSYFYVCNFIFLHIIEKLPFFHLTIDAEL